MPPGLALEQLVLEMVALPVMGKQRGHHMLGIGILGTSVGTEGSLWQTSVWMVCVG